MVIEKKADQGTDQGGAGSQSGTVDKVKIGDAEMSVADAQDLIAKGQDYTKKTQELADNRSAFDTERTNSDEAWETFKENNPKSAALIEKSWAGDSAYEESGAATVEAGSVEDRLGKMEKGINAILSSGRTAETRKAEDDLEGEINAVKAKFEGIDQSEIDEAMAISYMKGGKLIEVVEQRRGRADANFDTRLQKWIKDKNLDNSLFTQGAGGGSPPPAGGEKLDLMKGDVRRSAMARLNNSG